MRTRQFILILLCNIFFISYNSSQNCIPVISPSSYCETAPALCLNELCYTTADTAITCCNNWCGNNTIINNPQYFLITPALPDVEINIHVDDCSNGVGLQSAILDACPWDNTNVLDCNPGTPPGGTMILQDSSLIPGQAYWLVIDGSNGAVCHYTISSASGVQNPTLPDSLDATLSFPSDSLVCPGYQNLILNTGPEIPGAIYQWTLGWKGESITSSVPSITINIDEGSPEGTWNVCVTALTGCDTAQQICFPIQIGSTPTAIKDTVTLCNNIFPFLWHGQTITGPGDYSATFTDEHLCSFDSTWTILAYPSFPHGVIDTLVCSPQFNYGDQVFDHSGDYVVALPGQNINGCDSLVDVHVTIGAPDQFVEVACENNEMVLKTHITAQDESIDTVTFEWYSCSFDSLLSTSTELNPDTAGCFSLIVNSGLCLDTISSTYSMNPCTDSLYYFAGIGCVGEEMFLTTPQPLENSEQIDWLINIPGMPILHFENEDSIQITVNETGIYLASVTIRDSINTNTWIGYIQVLVEPEVTLCCDQSICSDSCTIITISSTSFANVVFTNGFSINGLLGAYQIPVCPFEGDDLTYTISEISSDYPECPGKLVGDSSVTIETIDRPFVSIVPFEDTLCTYPNNLASYKWRHCDSTAILSIATCFAPPASGCYCLEVENEFGCSYETCYNFFPETTSTIPEDQLQIFPNPTSGLIQIKLSGATNFPVLWELTDLQGKGLLTGELEENVSDTNLNSIPPGIYFLKFNLKSKGILTRKIVIE